MADEETRPGLGDDQGTRVGAPTPGAAHGEGGAAERPHVGENGSTHGGERTDAGAEATKGSREADKGAAKPSHDREHESGYGGSGGAPKNY